MVVWSATCESRNKLLSIIMESGCNGHLFRPIKGCILCDAIQADWHSPLRAHLIPTGTRKWWWELLLLDRHQGPCRTCHGVMWVCIYNSIYNRFVPHCVNRKHFEIVKSTKITVRKVYLIFAFDTWILLVYSGKQDTHIHAFWIFEYLRRLWYHNLWHKVNLLKLYVSVRFENYCG